MTEEDLKEASGGDRGDWFEEGGCPELSKVEQAIAEEMG